MIVCACYPNLGGEMDTDESLGLNGQLGYLLGDPRPMRDFLKRQ